jgi:hypothetical protein
MKAASIAPTADAIRVCLIVVGCIDSTSKVGRRFDGRRHRDVHHPILPAVPRTGLRDASPLKRIVPRNAAIRVDRKQ